MDAPASTGADPEMTEDVALAELLSTTLLTADRKVAKAAGTACPVEVFG